MCFPGTSSRATQKSMDQHNQLPVTQAAGSVGSCRVWPAELRAADQEKELVTNLYCRVVQFHSKTPLGWRAGPGMQKSPKLSPRLLQLSGNICFWSCRSQFPSTALSLCCPHSQCCSPGCTCHLSWQHRHLHTIFQFCLLSNFSNFPIKIKFKYCLWLFCQLIFTNRMMGQWVVW